MIKISANIDIVQNHYDKISKNINGEFPCWSIYSIETILKANPRKLHEISRWFNTLSPTEKQMFDFIKSRYETFTRKKTHNKYDAYKLAESLNINTCPYCNRNPTYTVIDKEGKKITRPEFDHFYDKATYPILSLSFYNLIPSCHTCNSSLKGSETFSIKTHLHPYSDNFNDKVKFHLHINDSSFFYDEKGFKIELKTKDKRAEKHIESFKLETLYQNHKDIVLELIQKREIYPDSYIDELAHNYSGLFKNREDLLRLITSGYVEDKDLNKRPLSKLIKDISEELELL